MKCVHEKVVKRGFRKTNIGRKQLYLCKKCGKKVTTEWPHMRFKKNDVMHAVRLYKRGMSAAKVKDSMESYGVKVSRWTIIKWNKRFG